MDAWRHEHSFVRWLGRRENVIPRYPPHTYRGRNNIMCAANSVPENVSRTSVAFGIASLVILLTGFTTGSWVTTREPYRMQGTDAYTAAAAFRIGLWKICPTLKKINSTLSEYIKYFILSFIIYIKFLIVKVFEPRARVRPEFSTDGRWLSTENADKSVGINGLKIIIIEIFFYYIVAYALYVNHVCIYGLRKTATAMNSAGSGIVDAILIYRHRGRNRELSSTMTWNILSF